jgi:hypothetical protein
MGFLILPLVIGVMALPSPTPPGLADFTRLRDAVHDEVYVTDHTGQERRLTIIEAGETAVTAQIGFQSMQMSRDAIVSVDRARDGNVDGIVKGALIGLLIGSIAESSVSGADGRFLLQGALVYGGIGFLFDRGHVARQPLYRAAARQQP